MKYATLALKIALTLGLVAYIVTTAGFSALWQSLSAIHPAWVALAGALWLAQMLLSALRWYIVIHDQGIALPFWRCCAFYYSGYLIGLVMPATVGMDAARTKLLMSGDISLAQAARTVVKDRLLATSSVVAVAVASLPVLYSLISNTVALTGLTIVITGLVGTVIAALFGERVWALIPWAGKHLALVSTETRALLKHGKMAIPVILLGIVIQLLVIVQFWCLGQAVDFKAPWYTYFALVPAISILTMLPVTINGWGMRETALYKGMALMGIVSPLAVTVSIAYGLLSTAMGLGAAPILIRLFLTHAIDFRKLKARE